MNTAASSVTFRLRSSSQNRSMEAKLLKSIWIISTVLLPLYYLRFPLEAAGRPEIFDYGVVWLEWLPVWALLAFGWLRRGRALSFAKARGAAAA